MATMIPSFPNPYLWSRAEQRLFERLRDELPDDHVVMHDYGLPESPDHLCGEIDFLVLSKGGWLALEAKGGRIRFEEGLWYFSNRREGTEAPGESPFPVPIGHPIRSFRGSSDWLPLENGHSMLCPCGMNGI